MYVIVNRRKYQTRVATGVEEIHANHIAAKKSANGLTLLLNKH